MLIELRAVLCQTVCLSFENRFQITVSVTEEYPRPDPIDSRNERGADHRPDLGRSFDLKVYLS